MPKTKAISATQIYYRRFLIFGLTFLTTFLLGIKWVVSMPSEANLAAQIVMTVLFLLTSGWISLFFWSSVFGFFELLFHKNVPAIVWPEKQGDLQSKTAVLMPIYNENAAQVFANLAAIAQSLHQTGQGKHYDIFVLSDTTDPKRWVEEEDVWSRTKRLLPTEINLYYRRRAQNTARKSGNIEDFCHKWGA